MFKNWKSYIIAVTGHAHFNKISKIRQFIIAKQFSATKREKVSYNLSYLYTLLYFKSNHVKNNKYLIL